MMHTLSHKIVVRILRVDVNAYLYELGVLDGG